MCRGSRRAAICKPRRGTSEAASPQHREKTNVSCLTQDPVYYSNPGKWMQGSSTRALRGLRCFSPSETRLPRTAHQTSLTLSYLKQNRLSLSKVGPHTDPSPRAARFLPPGRCRISPPAPSAPSQSTSFFPQSDY